MARPCLRRPSNRVRASWRIDFPTTDAVWNLRAREVVFCLLNPTHRVLRDAGVFRPARPATLTTARQRALHLAVLARWAAARALPPDLRAWESGLWETYLAGLRPGLGATTVANHVSTIRELHVLAPVLSQGGLGEDPWPGRCALEVAEGTRTAGVSTSAIAPATWWPLVRAAWTWIDVFSDDLLDLRDALAPDAPSLGGGPAGAAGTDAALRAWLADPETVIPVRAGVAPDRAPVWHRISLAVTDGRGAGLFMGARPAVARRRRMVLDAVAAGGRTEAPHLNRAAVGARTPSDESLRAWLADPAHRVPVRDADNHLGAAGTPAWKALSALIWGEGAHGFPTSPERRHRRTMVEKVVATGRTVGIDARGTARDLPLDSGHFTPVDRPDGTCDPWHTTLTARRLDDELRILPAAAWIFTAATTLIRDSELQEIERDAMTVHHGSPAVRSRRLKNDPDHHRDTWWVIEPVARAIAVAERLSWHPTHIFATLEPPTCEQARNGRRGINAQQALDTFIAHVNATAHRTGLQPVPVSTVRPHMFRRTMSMLAAREPDAEIALGLQLKHAARRALANRTTDGYAQPDPAWAREFDDDLADAAAAHLTELLTARTGGVPVAVGPGADRLHQGLDRVDALLDAPPAPPGGALRGHVADQHTVARLLRAEFPNLHWGTLNHCLFDPEQAECHKPLPETERGTGPVIGACHPARCRNSAVTTAHAPVWLSERDDLAAMLRTTRLAPPRRAALRARPADVEQVTDALTRIDENGDNP
ncbi:hypothetical protein [Embleya sp. NPDC005971]|uniref:hypothetical protein n=1 Tax=Embleya sp. NPDC005971 TaxID=3156724 RepID=UPI0033E32A00